MNAKLEFCAMTKNQRVLAKVAMMSSDRLISVDRFK
jgi:hypothetical protein